MRIGLGERAVTAAQERDIDEATVLEPEGFDALLAALRARGWTPIGPVERDGAVVLEEIEGRADLPVGRRDVQAPGRYRLEDRDDAALFGFNLGPQSFKAQLFPAELRLFSARRNGSGFVVEAGAEPPPRLAFVGARPCELAAFEIHDRVLTGGAHVDAWYAAARADAFVVAVQCTTAADTCFCTSMEAGPRAEAGFDLALTELVGDGEHLLLVQAGSERGRELLAALHPAPALAEHRARALAATARVEAAITRRLDRGGLPELLARNLEAAHWDDVASRCLSCANCTLVCPTCFCHTVEDRSDLTGDHTERWRTWDSCFTGEHGHTHGGDVRPSIRARYRQWLTHKLGTWEAQFGTPGCTGCGRCIAWCPAGIDLVAEVAALRRADAARGGETA